MKLSGTKLVMILSIICAICPYHFAQKLPPQYIKLPPRRLSEEQKTKLKQELGKISDKIKIRIVSPAAVQSDESWTYANDFAEVLKEAEWPLDGGDAGTAIRRVRFTGTRTTGTFLLVSAQEKRVPPGVLKLLSVLRSNHVPIIFQSSDDLPKGVCEIRVLFRDNETPSSY